MRSLRRAGVTIDFCERCFSVWLDAGEARVLAASNWYTDADLIPKRRSVAGLAFDALDVLGTLGELVVFVAELFG